MFWYSRVTPWRVLVACWNDDAVTSWRFQVQHTRVPSFIDHRMALVLTSQNIVYKSYRLVRQTCTLTEAADASRPRGHACTSRWRTICACHQLVLHAPEISRLNHVSPYTYRRERINCSIQIFFPDFNPGFYNYNFMLSWVGKVLHDAIFR